MSQRLHEKIRHLLDANSRLTQRGLAEAMGLDPAAVNRMLYGRRSIMAEEMPVIEAYLGQSLTLSAPQGLSAQRGTPPRGVSDVDAPQTVLAPPDAVLPVVPVYALTDTGRDTPIDYVPRHPQQIGMAEAFAFYVPDDALAPRYYAGEMIYLHPTRPPQLARDCAVILKSDTVEVVRLLRQTESKLCVASYISPIEKDILRKNVTAVYAVVGRG